MSRKSGLSKIDQTLLKKHVAAGSSAANIAKVFKDVDAKTLAGWVKQFSDGPAKAAKPAKKAAAKAPAAPASDDII